MMVCISYICLHSSKNQDFVGIFQTRHFIQSLIERNMNRCCRIDCVFNQILILHFITVTQAYKTASSCMRIPIIHYLANSFSITMNCICVNVEIYHHQNCPTTQSTTSNCKLAITIIYRHAYLLRIHI